MATELPTDPLDARENDDIQDVPDITGIILAQKEHGFGATLSLLKTAIFTSLVRRKFPEEAEITQSSDGREAIKFTAAIDGPGPTEKINVGELNKDIQSVMPIVELQKQGKLPGEALLRAYATTVLISQNPQDTFNRLMQDLVAIDKYPQPKNAHTIPRSIRQQITDPVVSRADIRVHIATECIMHLTPSVLARGDMNVLLPVSKLTPPTIQEIATVPSYEAIQGVTETIVSSLDPTEVYKQAMNQILPVTN